ncbi:MAG: DUF3313 domain-containing protein [Deltaproteobacteria bacterium]|nr:DUF3313 domain-containing protein [Deltaproteobacteria bacterium]
MNNKFKIILVLMIGFALTISVGCATSKGYSGFLSNYSQLKPDPEKQADMLYMASPYKLRAYKKFIIDPVVVHFAPKAKGTTISPKNLKKLTDYFEIELVKALSNTKRYRVVSVPGPGVLRIRAAITDIKKTKPVMNIIPQTKLTGVGLGGASFEAEAVDSVSDEQLGAVVDSKKGTIVSVVSGLKTFGDAEYVMKKWAKRLVKRLDEIHGYK